MRTPLRQYAVRAGLRVQLKHGLSAPRRSRPLCRCIAIVVRFVHTRSAPLVEGLKPPSQDLPRFLRESSLLDGRSAAAKTASKAGMAKLASFRQNTALEDV
jgi:hypothetical protein